MTNSGIFILRSTPKNLPSPVCNFFLYTVRRQSEDPLGTNSLHTMLPADMN